MMGVDKDNFAGLLVGLILPAAQSIVTGIFLWLFIWPISSVLWEYAAYEGITLVGSPFLLGLTSGMGVAFLMWLNLRSRWHEALETLLGADLNRDGVIGAMPEEEWDGGWEGDVEPIPIETEAKQVKVFIHEDKHTKVFDLPIEHDVLVKVARLLLQRRVFTYADFSGPGKLLSRSDFEKVRQELVARGVLVRNGEKNAPPSLTRPGAATMRAIVSQEGGPPSSG